MLHVYSVLQSTHFDLKETFEFTTLLYRLRKNDFYHHLYFFLNRAATATPTNSTRVTPLSMRRRSPSPVVTAQVSRARMRFESGGSVKNNKTSPSLVAGLEPLTSQHQTLPRTFRFMNNNCNNSSMDTKATINRFLSGSSYANNINTVI